MNSNWNINTWCTSTLVSVPADGFRLALLYRETAVSLFFAQRIIEERWARAGVISLKASHTVCHMRQVLVIVFYGFLSALYCSYKKRIKPVIVFWGAGMLKLSFNFLDTEPNSERSFFGCKTRKSHFYQPAVEKCTNIFYLICLSKLTGSVWEGWLIC